MPGSACSGCCGSIVLTLPEAFFVPALAPDFYAPMRRLAAASHDRQAAVALSRYSAAAPAMLSDPPSIRFEAATVRYPTTTGRRSTA